MRVFLRILGTALLVLLTFGLFGSGNEPAGPGGTLGAVDAGAGFLDTVLLFGAGVGMIAMSFYKRPKPSNTTVSSPRTQFVSTGNGGPSTKSPAPVVEARSNTKSDQNDVHPEGTTKVTVLGYRERFAINPSVKIFWKGIVIGEVGREGRFECERQGGGTLKFKSSIRSADLEVPAGANAVVQLAWDRVSGKLLIHVVP
ncbi:hypothetical protein A20C1_00335 [marine actinobacterium PHSC20C1]|nr:hypothetical protein A20C1_00335 [marine actinobacterium PHSC20C1]